MNFFMIWKKMNIIRTGLLFGFDLSKIGLTAPTIYYKHISDYINGAWVHTYTMVVKFNI
ncbi:MAG: hypothetical protein Ct9H90mP20_4720 [Candidatus Neomarinimicrobiota bacterium]|nr:MAG: hypothetical protein Ct9H90mP20_4720 [Candidatus Neomarinimicrobiota bacterium]